MLRLLPASREGMWAAERLHPPANPGAAKTPDYPTEKSRSLVKERSPWADAAGKAHWDISPEADLASSDLKRGSSL